MSVFTDFCSWNLSNEFYALTLIRPGEVKVDLADFDLKLQENMQRKCLPKLSELLTWTQKMTFWRTFWRFFVRNPAASLPCRPCSPFANQHSNQFPVAGRVECGGGGFAVGPIISLFISGPLAPHWSGHVPETGSLYSTVTHHTCYSLLRPGSFNLDLIGLPILVRSEV